MSERPIVVVGSLADGHVDAVVRALKDRGRETFVVDSLSFPESIAISLTDRLDGISVDGVVLDRPAAVYVRDAYSHPLSVGLDVRDEMETDWRRTLVAFREKGQVLFSLLARWHEMGVPMYNPPTTDWRHSKPFQLALLQAAGLPVPRTIWTNDPGAVRDFAGGGRVAYKPVAGGAATRELSPDDLTPDRLRALRGAPVTFQELLEGDNFRVYCLDGEIVAAFRVTSEALDYRQNDEVIEEYALPPEVLDLCVKAAGIIGLRWTGIDLRQDAEGSFRFLELNPSPMFLGFDSRAGTDVLGAFADALAGHPG
ncbi:MAG: ATP-grasp domain-containing protein [Actinomycetota bacterium]